IGVAFRRLHRDKLEGEQVGIIISKSKNGFQMNSNERIRAQDKNTLKYWEMGRCLEQRSKSKWEGRRAGRIEGDYEN
ncbi:hypothetical protein BaRGS_00004488, partial [Batillaria attramentaria]